jgi:hypothetical protein
METTKKYVEVVVTKTKPADISRSWNNVETIVSYKAYDSSDRKVRQEVPCTEAEALAAWNKIKRECGEFANTLIGVGETDTFSCYIILG